MSYAIVGSGSVGTALATQFARHGIEVAITNTRGPGSLVPLVNSLGPVVRPVTLKEALEAGIIVFAVPFASHEGVARTRADWSGKTVIDAMNYRDLNLESIGGLTTDTTSSPAGPQASDWVGKPRDFHEHRKQRSNRKGLLCRSRQRR